MKASARSRSAASTLFSASSSPLGSSPSRESKSADSPAMALDQASRSACSLEDSSSSWASKAPLPSRSSCRLPKSSSRRESAGRTGSLCREARSAIGMSAWRWLASSRKPSSDWRRSPSGIDRETLAKLWLCEKPSAREAGCALVDRASSSDGISSVGSSGACTSGMGSVSASPSRSSRGSVSASSSSGCAATGAG